MDANAEATAELKRRLRRALTVTIGMAVVLLVTILPYNISSLGQAQLSGLWNRVLLFLAYANPAIDPFVYLLLVPKVRHAVSETFGCGGSMSGH